MQQCGDTATVINTDSYPNATQAKVTESYKPQVEVPQQLEVAQAPITPTALDFTTKPFLDECHTNTAPKTIIDESRFTEQISTLKLREARIVAKLLGITQKVNGKDKPLDWLQREIRQKLTSDRAVVISALQQLKAS